MFVVNEHLEAHLMDFQEGDGEDDDNNDDGKVDHDAADSDAPQEPTTTPRIPKGSLHWRGMVQNDVLLGVTVVAVAMVAASGILWVIVVVVSASAVGSVIYLDGIYRSWKKTNRLERIMSGRLRIVASLGRIQAPPLRSIPDSLELSTSDKYCTDLVHRLEEFAAGHADLLCSVDRCIERLRMSTGISLGIGPVSPSVERVERSASSVKAGGVRLPSSLRQALVQVLQRQVESMQLDASTADFTLEVPDVLTLSWFRETRVDVGELLSQTLTDVFLAHYQPSSLSYTEQKVMLDQLRNSTFVAQELICHLDAAFGRMSSSATNSTRSERATITKNLQQQLEVASVTLWACLPSETTDDPETENFEKWLSHFENEIASICETTEVLRSLLNKDEDEEAKRVDDVGSGQSTPDRKSDVQESYEFNACAERAKPNNQREQRHSEQEKAFVFSGRGKKPTQSRAQSSAPSHSTGGRSVQAVNARDQAMLFNELETRLSIMIHPVEEDVVSDEENEIAESLGDRPGDNMTLGGVSGGLLAELQNAIAIEQGQDESAIEG